MLRDRRWRKAIDTDEQAERILKFSIHFALECIEILESDWLLLPLGAEEIVSRFEGECPVDLFTLDAERCLRVKVE